MIEPASVDSLRSAVEGLHGGTATLVRAVPIRDEFEGEIAWEGVVHVFALDGNDQASLAYAWSSPIEGSDKRRLFAVLHQPPINSAVDAVRAAIASEHRQKERLMGRGATG